ncbi:MAG: TniQ family protein [Pleurocapsa sp. MO_192.B19]|nr:TniQ family protein [Pleurocapsa sp. MO_192.B19]
MLIFASGHLLTLANFSELIPSRKLFHEHRKWCPQCIDSWKKQQHELYEPLIWKIKAVEVCSIHNSPLQDKCSYCDRPNYHLAWKTRPGYCSKCDRWLGEVDQYRQLSLQDKDLNWYLWVNENIGELLSKGKVEDFTCSKKTISESLTKYAESNFQGNMAAFARYLQMPKNTVWMWCKNKSQPSLEMLLRICYRLEISVWDFLTQEEPTQSQAKNVLASPPQLKSKAWKTTHDRDRIREHLEQILRDNNSDPPSMEQVARDLQISRRTIFQHFPELCRAISANYTKHRKATHQQAIESSCQEVREAVRQLHSEGKYPSQNKVEKLVSRPGLLRYKEVKEAFAQAKQELNR